MADFKVVSHGSVWHIEALSDNAKEFAEDAFEVEAWQGTPTNFTTDWRPALQVVQGLEAAGFVIE